MTGSITVLDRSILAGPTLDAARALIGARLVREVEGPAAGAIDRAWTRRVGRIVEVEAYIGVEDRASHARFGRTSRNAVMFGPPGLAYVYLVYGMYDCLNVVTEPEARPAAVLIRAVEPLEGESAIRAARAEWSRRRHRVEPGGESAIARIEARLDAIPSPRLCSGPGLVCAGFSITRDDTGRDLLDPASPLRLEAATAEDRPLRLETTARIGIGYASEPWQSRPWRFVDRSSAAVSGPR